MSEKFQFHVSALLDMARCGERFRRRYIEGERAPSTPSLIRGTAVHRSVERNLRARLEDPAKLALLPAEEVADIARDAASYEWENGVRLTKKESAIGLEKARGELLDRVVRLSLEHRKALAPNIKPSHVERQWTVDIKGYPFQLAGQIDIQEVSFDVRDTKTSRKTPSGNPAETSIQLSCYALAVQKHDGVLPKSVGLDYLIDLKRGTKIVEFRSDRTDDFRPFLDRVAIAHAAMEKGIFQPAHPDDWCCSDDYCSFFDSCRYVRRPVSTGGGLVQIAPVEGTNAA